MWDVIKNAVTELKDALGIEIPGLPIDVGSVDAASIADAATTAAQGVTDSAAGAAEDLTAAADTPMTETVSGITDAAR
jgi:hypothetical protein